MNDFRNIANDRNYISTFIVGARYVTILHINASFAEIIEAISEHLGEAFKKPFVCVSQALIYSNDWDSLIEYDLVDIVLEG